MRLGTKIIIGFICISLLLVFIGFISDKFTSEIRQEQLRSVNEASQVVIYTGDMERSLFQSLIFLNSIREALIVEKDYNTIQKLPAVTNLTSQFDTELEQFESALGELELLLGNNESLPEDVNELLMSYEVYKSISREWLSLGEENSTQANLMFINSIEPYFRNNIIPEITQLRNYVLEIQQDRNQLLDESLKQAASVNYFATAFSVFLAIVLAVYIYRSIANPLSRVSNSAKMIGEGKLDERIKVTSNDEIGELAKAFNTMAAGLQKSTVSKAYLDNIIESIQEALFVADNDGVLLKANSAAAKLVGYGIDEMMNKPLSMVYNFSEMGEVYSEKHSTDHSFEFSLVHKNSHSIPVLFSEAELLDNQGNKVGSVAVASDISERKKAEKKIRDSLKEKEVMLAEIHHRVKNNLAVISGLLQLQSFKANNTDVEKALGDSQMRIQSIALVHEMLYKSESLAYIKYDKYINDLLQAISSMHMNDGKHIKLVAEVDESISLSVNQAIPCSLLINELVVNAFKHAFNNSKEGEIKVGAIDQDGKIIMTISDNGSGFDIEKFTDSDSLGATLIKTLSMQLNGDFEILKSPGFSGSAFRIRFSKKLNKL
ncbi:MAG TPA: histidine kinase dimerization/phosphoacceptor domain -containing protein [Gracilimonas sp.]|uniref:histidine kinase dimerization/phosphoacceptor domain -containing protein n=1 Tax=Gracilimonas sp. TaxID=1974203 RepID=UPI002D948E40|nr:histidine kinase dimerization/phosphoacceptor domain -containing protein [Gracilimonas sp.]